MIARKICMVGGYAVGKTSLVRQFVESMFSEKYQTTVGVKVDKRVVDALGRKVTLVIWDIQGQDDRQRFRETYLRGAAGYLVVCDGTRAETLSEALELSALARDNLGEVPSLLLVNKSDLHEEWEIESETLRKLEQDGWRVFRTSAKDGSNVKEAFQLLATAMLIPTGG